MSEHAEIHDMSVCISELPQAAQDLVRLIGLRGTVALVEQLGGTTFPVALNLRKLGHLRYDLLAEVVGPRAADTLTREYGGTELYIPRCSDALRRARDRAICAEFDQMIAPGSDASGRDAAFTLARKYRMSDRQVWQILKSTDTTGGGAQKAQCSLF